MSTQVSRSASVRSRTITGPIAVDRLVERRRNDASATGVAAGVGGEGEPKHIDRFVAAPQQGPLTMVEPTQPVPSRVAETAGPVVIESVVRAHLALGVDLQARLLDTTAGAPVDPCVAPVPRHLPPLVIGVVVRSQI